MLGLFILGTNQSLDASERVDEKLPQAGISKGQQS
jgi:hypothetical protein